MFILSHILTIVWITTEEKTSNTKMVYLNLRGKILRVSVTFYMNVTFLNVLKMCILIITPFQSKIDPDEIFSNTT